MSSAGIAAQLTSTKGRDGTREGALHMTEELALDELCGDRGTVDFDEGAFLAW
jgi:hypothetical protein